MFVIQQGKEKSMGRKSTRENKTIYQQLREEDNLPRKKPLNFSHLFPRTA